MNITEHTSKDEVISNAVELIDSQEQQLNTLQEQQKILFVLLGTLFIYTILWKSSLKLHSNPIVRPMVQS